MKFQNVCIESLGYTLPTESWSSAEVEQRLAPLYQRLKLPPGRLELMTGIEHRRFWPADILPGTISIASGRAALQAADWNPGEVHALIHGSVCRDHLEPATSCRVHHALKLPAECVIYDVSNACLGILNGMLQAASMIELGQVQSALVVGSENGRQLVENTIKSLNADETLNRRSIKNAVASLTIGSASCAVLLTHRDVSNSGNRLLGATAHANTVFHDLCQSGRDEAGGDMRPLMATDSEQLMNQGVKTGAVNFARFLGELSWQRSNIDRTFCHQVGSTHRKLMLEALGLDIDRDFATYSWLGNTGAAALPTTMAIGLEQDAADKADGQTDSPLNLALLGIGSGINCVMAGVEWHRSRIGRGAL